ncbi:MAG TPA: PqqD family protein [Micromonosporaceae bacterium]
MTTTPLPRPTLIPGLVRLWRDRHTLQLGIDPSRAVLLEIADPRTARILDLLDGTRSEHSVLAQAVKSEVAPEDARAFLDTLRAAGLIVAAQALFPHAIPEPTRSRLTAEAAALALRRSESPGTPAQILRRRTGAKVVVTGQGRLAAPLAVALAQAGVGHVHPDVAGRVEPTDLPGGGLRTTDIGRDRAQAIIENIAQAAPGAQTRPIPRGRADLVIQIGLDRPAGLVAAAFERRRQAHLLLGVRDGVPTVGPLVPAAGSPCLNCLDLHRRDRDPAWPQLAAQLAAAAPPEPCQLTALLTATAYAASEALAYLDGGTPETIGAAVEIETPTRIRRRVWPPHPDCDCGHRRRPAKSTKRTDGGQAAAKARSHDGRGCVESVTMAG